MVRDPHWKVDRIEKDTPLHRTTIDDALDWLHNEGLITVDYGEVIGGGIKKSAKPKGNKKRGRIQIESTCEMQERIRTEPNPNRVGYLHRMSKAIYPEGI
jgi:hypothetical protein